MKKKIVVALGVCAIMLLLTGINASKNIGIRPFGDPPFPLVKFDLK